MARKTRTRGPAPAPNETLPSTDVVEDAVVVTGDETARPDAAAAADIAAGDDAIRVPPAPGTDPEKLDAAPEGPAAPVTGEAATPGVEDAVLTTGGADAEAVDPSPEDQPGGDADSINPTPGDSGAMRGVSDPGADPAALVDAPDAARDEPSTAYADIPPPAAPPPGAPGSSKERGPGFVPLVLGGLLAGAIGYAIPTYVLDEDAPIQAPAAEDRLAALESDIAALRAGDDGLDVTERLDGLDARVAALEELPDDPAEQAAGASTAGLDTGEAPGLPPQIVALPEDLAALDERLQVLEDREDPAADLDAVAGRVDDLASQVDGLAGLADRVDGLAGRLDALPPVPELGDLPDRVAALETEIGALEDRTAQDAAEAEAAARADAEARLRLAVEGGQPYAEELAALPEAPAGLAANAETGVARADALAAAFPPLAREALRAARGDETLDGGGIGSLAGRFLNARSLEPRAGDDPDAVLSRAEAALRQGEVATALDELEALPDSARAPLQDWLDRARARVETRAALNDFLQDE